MYVILNFTVFIIYKANTFSISLMQMILDSVTFSGCTVAGVVFTVGFAMEKQEGKASDVWQLKVQYIWFPNIPSLS